MALIDSEKLLKKAVWIYDGEGFGTKAVPLDDILKIIADEREETHWGGVYAPYTEYKLVMYKCPACGVSSVNQPEKCPRCGTPLLKHEEQA